MLELKNSQVLVWTAGREVGTPLCIGQEDEWSLTIYRDDNGEPIGVLRHTYEDGTIVNVEGAGLIPARAVADDENRTIR